MVSGDSETESWFGVPRGPPVLGTNVGLLLLSLLQRRPLWELGLVHPTLREELKNASS